jgi:hypothetical protein
MLDVKLSADDIGGLYLNMDNAAIDVASPKLFVPVTGGFAMSLLQDYSPRHHRGCYR